MVSREQRGTKRVAQRGGRRNAHTRKERSRSLHLGAKKKNHTSPAYEEKWATEPKRKRKEVERGAEADCRRARNARKAKFQEGIKKPKEI